MKIKTIAAALAVWAALPLFAQQKIIRGKVTDATDGSPVSFARVNYLKLDSIPLSGTSSNLSGYFELSGLFPESGFLSIDFTGYEPVCLPVKSAMKSDTLYIQLKPSAVRLNEVVIQARSVLTKNDRTIILPTQEQIRTATDGADLVRKMQLPRIMVDPVSGEVSISGGGTVQLRINGVLVTPPEIASLSPADILRIEYHDDPGARYGNTGAVIDYITRRQESGGRISGVLFHSIGGKRTSADDRISFKHNHRKSEFSANAGFVQRKLDWTREYDERLSFPEHELHRLEIGEPTRFNKKVFSSNVNYSLVEKDRYFVNAQLRYTHNDFPNGFEDRQSKLYTAGEDTPLRIYDHTEEKSNSPALDLYFQRDLKNEQSLIVNAVGTYIGTDSRRVYREGRADSFDTEIRSDVDGTKYSLIAEGIYEKKIQQHKISAGIKHMQSYTHNQYTSTINHEISMRQAESSLYAEYAGRFGKWGFMGNVGGGRLYYSQKGTHKEKYAFQPSARISFEPDRNLYFRYKAGLRSNAPSPGVMNEVEQVIDTWQIRRGNPDLDAFYTLEQRFTAGYSKGFFGMDLLIGYEYEYKPIMESVFYENGKFIRMSENQKSFQNLSAEATFRFKPWKEYVSLSVTPRMNRYISTGNEYLHTYTMPELRVNLDLTYHNWQANFTTITPPRFMYGEQLTKSDQMYTIMAGYKTAAYSLMVGVLNPFTSAYKTENKNWASADLVDSKIHTRHNRSFLVRLGFNLNYGRHFKEADRRTHNMDTDPGIIQGVKN